MRLLPNTKLLSGGASPSAQSSTGRDPEVRHAPENTSARRRWWHASISPRRLAAWLDMLFARNARAAGSIRMASKLLMTTCTRHGQVKRLPRPQSHTLVATNRSARAMLVVRHHLMNYPRFPRWGGCIIVGCRSLSEDFTACAKCLVAQESKHPSKTRICWQVHIEHGIFARSRGAAGSHFRTPSCLSSSACYNGCHAMLKNSTAPHPSSMHLHFWGWFL
jgi:hypothetical protein